MQNNFYRNLPSIAGERVQGLGTFELPRQNKHKSIVAMANFIKFVSIVVPPPPSGRVVNVAKTAPTISGHLFTRVSIEVYASPTGGCAEVGPLVITLFIIDRRILLHKSGGGAMTQYRPIYI